MSAVEKLSLDLHKMIIGDMLAIQPKLYIAIHDVTRAGVTTPFIANEDTLSDVIQHMLWHIRDQEFSLDVRAVKDTVAVIRVRTYYPKLEGLI